MAEFERVCRTICRGHDFAAHETYQKTVKIVSAMAEILADVLPVPTSWAEIDGRRYPVCGAGTGLNGKVATIDVVGLDGFGVVHLYTDIRIPGTCEPSDAEYLEYYGSGRACTRLR